MPVSSGTTIAPAGHVVGSRASTYYLLGADISTSASLGNGTLRAAPIYVPQRVTLDRIGAEITVVGEAGSKLRLGIYADNGNLYPGALLLDAGQINGDSATVQEITISQALDPGVYWLAGVVQSAPTTQPTVRTALEFPFCPSSSANTPVSVDRVGLTNGGIPGALPATFTTTPATADAMPRIFVRAA